MLNRSTKEFEPAYWHEVVVGDYVKVTARSVVPADVLIVKVSPSNGGDSGKQGDDEEEETGVCYVETKSLDGETNLKQKAALPVLLGGN